MAAWTLAPSTRRPRAVHAADRGGPLVRLRPSSPRRARNDAGPAGCSRCAPLAVSAPRHSPARWRPVTGRTASGAWGVRRSRQRGRTGGQHVAGPERSGGCLVAARISVLPPPHGREVRAHGGGPSSSRRLSPPDGTRAPAGTCAWGPSSRVAYGRPPSPLPGSRRRRWPRSAAHTSCRFGLLGGGAPRTHAGGSAGGGGAGARMLGHRRSRRRPTASSKEPP